MRIIIMRHGQAAWSAPSDALRPLTDIGLAEVTSTANELKHRYHIDHVFTSPYLRAKQTGAIAAEVFGCNSSELAELTPESHPSALLAQLPEYPEDYTVLLVSHMPFVGALTSLLCDGVSGYGMGFHTAMAVVLEMDMIASGLAALKETVMPDE